ncbi:MAG: translation initiation factor IF-2 [Clostridia bacterium]|nr:translation initiation factor IF-2 [Clostridia bacterium]
MTAPAEKPVDVKQEGKQLAKPVEKTFKPSAKPAAENRTFVNRDTRPQNRPARTGAPNYNNNNSGGYNKTGAKFSAPSVPVAPAVQTAKAKNFGPDKKKGYEKTYVEKEKRTVSKRTLQKQQGASIDDFDENKSGYRKLRVKKDKKQLSSQTIKIEHAVVTTNDIPLKVLSEKLGISAVEITKRLFKEGIMKTVNESIDYDTAALVAAGLDIELEYKPEKTAEEVLFEKQADTVEEIESLVPRAPVVTVMGHVDHGKTSLLDYIRNTNAAAGEAGGITQHIGAYTVTVNDKGITFIDTPGHEAFTAMRARGAQVTDIVILVVAADDGIMPQTVEAINHAKAAGVQILVAVNKMDKAGANIDKVKQDLTNYGLVPEEWGGDTVVCPISCKTGEGIDALLENLLLIAEMKELLANPAREARGVIIEARLDKGKGPVATVLVQNGTLHTGDNIISGTVTGRVRAMIDDKGKTVKEAGPSMAVNVLGLEEVPNSGDNIYAVSQALMKEVIEERKRKESDAMIKSASKVSLEEMFGMIADGNLKTLNLIIKGDVQGSVEAVKQSVVKLSNEEVQVKVIHSGAGAITETDVMLADSSNAIILGFNVRPDTKAKTLAERSKVDVRTYRIIYDLLDDIESALKGMLAPKYHEVYLGKCEVRQTFKITGVGNIAGCYVMDGKIIRGGKLRIYRENVLVVEGNVQQLKRFKDDVKEVSFGFECGCAIEGFNDIKIGDIIECYMIEQVNAG